MRKPTVLLPVLLAFLVGAEPALAWTWPADGPVLQSFTYNGNHYGGGQHRGVDIGASPGASVTAPRGGVVTFSGSVPGGGRTVTISTPDGFAVTLLHLGPVAVIRGDVVAEGDVIAAAGVSGEPEVSEPYVHLGVRRLLDLDGYLDPLRFLPAREGLPASSPSPQEAGAPKPGLDGQLTEIGDEPPGSTDRPAVEPVAYETSPSVEVEPPAEQLVASPEAVVGSAQGVVAGTSLPSGIVVAEASAGETAPSVGEAAPQRTASPREDRSGNAGEPRRLERSGTGSLEVRDGRSRLERKESMRAQRGRGSVHARGKTQRGGDLAASGAEEAALPFAGKAGPMSLDLSKRDVEPVGAGKTNFGSGESWPGLPDEELVLVALVFAAALVALVVTRRRPAGNGALEIGASPDLAPRAGVSLSDAADRGGRREVGHVTTAVLATEDTTRRYLSQETEQPWRPIERSDERPYAGLRRGRGVSWSPRRHYRNDVGRPRGRERASV